MLKVASVGDVPSLFTKEFSVYERGEGVLAIAYRCSEKCRIMHVSVLVSKEAIMSNPKLPQVADMFDYVIASWASSEEKAELVERTKAIIDIDGEKYVDVNIFESFLGDDEEMFGNKQLYMYMVYNIDADYELFRLFRSREGLKELVSETKESVTSQFIRHAMNNGEEYITEEEARKQDEELSGSFLESLLGQVVIAKVSRGGKMESDENPNRTSILSGQSGVIHE